MTTPSPAPTPADEIRAALTTWRERAAAARAATMTGRADEWDPWYLVHNKQPDPTRPSVSTDSPWGPMTGPAYTATGEAAVAHDRLTHTHEDAMYEAHFFTGMLDARVAAWITLTSPAMAEFIEEWLDHAADDMDDHGAFERYAGTALTGPDRRRVVANDCGQIRHDWTAALALARRINEPLPGCEDTELAGGGE
ncbi:hypothetical protein GCM10010404_80840 [Nonomuraea africana]|uniref:Uncharacterized protein n=1 Tax=Nonomuraea africana TaxID=46171 RepID=A0ABR9KWZ0_9ACTN|nr:hypothetical protein [Nonomuraea africana]MBE1566538.1 hypothetical protein [Nonomuraea africana]